MENNLKYWIYRKKKFYNPQGLCLHCLDPVSPHQKICQTCLDDWKYQAEDYADYQDTLASIRADWHR